MADGKLDLPDDLLSSKTLDQHRSAKDEAWGGTGEEKSVMGLLDESKVADQTTLDSSIPLSPQWLYAKPIDGKTSSAGASGEMRAANSLPHGNSIDTNLKDSWRLDGSQDKKDWRKTVPDIESNRRWREEERETGLLGRRDRRKEDRRADTTDTSENRPLSSTDHWHDPNNRNSGHGSRRDSKWTSRWGPEEKDNDYRTEKRTDAEKEDIQIDRQSFVSGNRRASERDNESRDKWRPRHRMEVHVGGSAAYRSAPGFGPERGRAEGSNVRFAVGRGRSADNGSVQRGRSPSVIGSVCVDKSCSSAAITYCYPRGRLLDIYRKHKIVPSFDAIPAEMEHVSPISQVAAIDPLAFVAPDAEEEAVLGDIWKGIVRSSGLLKKSFRDKNVASNDNGILGFDDTNGGQLSVSVLSEETIETVEKTAVHNSSQGTGAEGLGASDPQAVITEETDALIEGEGKFMTGTADVVIHDGSVPSIFNTQDTCSTGETCGLSNIVNELKYSESPQGEDLIFSKHSKLGHIEPATSLDVCGQLPDDSSSLFNFIPFQQNSSSDQLHLKSNDKAHSVDVLPPEELSLIYLDPQGVIQGPYMGIDIIVWFEQGYFGTDLPVRLSDAPAGSSFQELGEVMPHLKFKDGSAPASNLAATSELSDTVGVSMEGSLTPPASGPDFKGPAVFNNQLWVSTGFQATSSVISHSRVPTYDSNFELHYADDQNFQNCIAQDEIVCHGKPASSSGNQFRKSVADIQSSISSPASHHSLANEFSETSMPRHQDDDKLHPFGLLMSEIKDSSHLRHTQSSNMASGIGDQDQFMDSLLEREATFVSQDCFGKAVDQPSFKETLFDDYRRSTLSKQNIQQGCIDAHHLFPREQALNGFDPGERLISEKLRNELHHQNHLSYHSSHAFGLGIEEIPGFAHSQSMNLSLQQSAHPRLEMEQLLDLELQQQRHLELQQRRHLELQQQQRHLEELQQRRHLEELQQRRHLELQQLWHFEHQQQQHLEHQQQQQQVRLNQMKLLQQQQQLLVEHQMSDPGYGLLKVDPMRENLLDQVQLRMHLLHKLQNSQTRQLDPSMDQIIQAKIGQNTLGGQPAALLDLISQSKHGNTLSSEQQLHFQLEHLQGRQLSMALRQHLGLEGERHINGPWSVDEAGQFARNPAGHHQVQSAGFNSSDFYQQQRRLSSSEEQFDPCNWNHSMLEQHQPESYEPGSAALDRSISCSPAVAPAMNFDNVNACGQVLDFTDQHRYMQSTGQLGPFSSGIPSQSWQVSDEFYASHPDMIERHSPRNSGLLENNWIERQMLQLNLKAEQQRRELEINMNIVDSSTWASATGAEENSKQALMDLFHQNLGSSEVDYKHPISSSKSQEIVWPVFETHSSNLPFSHLPNQEVSESSSFMEGPQNFNTGAKLKHSGNSERFILRSTSGAPTIEQALSSGIVEHSISKSALDKDLSELQGLKGKRHGSKGMNCDFVEQAENSPDCGELPIKAHSRWSLLSTAGGNGGLYNYDIGLDKSLGEVSNDRLTSIIPKGLDNDRNKCSPVPRVSSSQDEPTAAPFVKQKSSTSLSSDEGKLEPISNPVARVPENQASGKKDLCFRRTSSGSDAAVSEASFIDMLKKPVHPEADPSNGTAFESSDGAPIGRGGKKKGKKGRQIDPALLGFKVSSNRIMMGEIQRLED